MTKITVDSALRNQLRGLRSAVELCDELGQTLGYFMPTQPELYRNAQVPATEEELDEIERTGGGRSLAEILADLERRG